MIPTWHAICRAAAKLWKGEDKMEKYREIKGRIGDAMDAARLERGRIAAIAQTDDYGDADTAGYTADAILQRTALDTMIDYLQEAYELAGALDVHERELDVN